jgi:uncharacterized protein (DUF2225 family)
MCEFQRKQSFTGDLRLIADDLNISIWYQIINKGNFPATEEMGVNSL